MKTLRLVLPYPPTVNTYWRSPPGSRPMISVNGRRYRKAVGEYIIINRQQLKIFKPISDPLRVLLAVSPPDRRRRDLDNICKAVLDSLCHAGVYLDDSQIDDLQVIRCDAMPGGQVHTTIQTIEVK